MVHILQPDITFFGEKLTDDFDKALLEDRPSVDLLLVIGTSLKVSPVAEILSKLHSDTTPKLVLTSSSALPAFCAASVFCQVPFLTIPIDILLDSHQQDACETRQSRCKPLSSPTLLAFR